MALDRDDAYQFAERAVKAVEKIAEAAQAVLDGLAERRAAQLRFEQRFEAPAPSTDETPASPSSPTTPQ